MKVIRSSVFETNSSSVHTVCIGPDVRENKTIEHYGDYKGKEFEVPLYEFGWYGDCSDVDEKISYLILLIWSTIHNKFVGDKDAMKKLNDANLWYPENEREYANALAILESTDEYARIERIVKEKTGCSKMVVTGTGYIDHQSYEDYKNLDEWLDEKGIDTDEKLATFIFGDSYINIDNDNH